MLNRLQRAALTIGTCATMLSIASVASASPYFQTNLVSDLPGIAQLTDPNLKNPWGMSFTATSPFWVSDQGTNVSTLYRVTNGVVSKVALTVAIPATATGPQGPTGQVANTTGGFVLGAAPSSFIFADLNGTISAWNGAAGSTAVIKATTPGAVYTGLAVAGTGANARLYAANGAGGRVDVFDTNFNPITVPGGFVDTDPGLAGLVPFNVANIGGQIYVTYALPGRAAQIAATAGKGAIAIFNTDGTLVKTLVTGSELASPWGLALAPVGFGGFAGDLLVGNFSFALSEINAFDPVTGALLGTIGDQAGKVLRNSGLWALAFGNGVTGDAKTLYFTAGINGEANGLFGAISAVPEPEVFALFGLGLVAMMAMPGRRRRRDRDGPSDLAMA